MREWTRKSERQSGRIEQFSREAEGRPKGAVELWQRDRDAQMIRQNIQEPEQMIKSERQIISSGRERTILLSNSTILQGHCHFVEEFFNFETHINNE